MTAAIALRRTGVLIALLILTLFASLLVNGRVALGVGDALAAPAPCDASSGTAFFASAGEGTEFHEGDTWQGGTFTFIENDHHMFVREESTGDLVGRFPMGFLLGDVATIQFDRVIVITAIFWWDNDPNPGEAGWSFNGIAGPLTGNQAGACTPVHIVTDTVTIDAGGDSGGIDFWFQEAGQGCTPGYWKNHLSAWGPTGYSPSQTLESVFDVPDSLGLDSVTLQSALSFPGGPGTVGGARILLRAAVASLLNAAHPGVEFPWTAAQVISAVNTALASLDRATMLALASELDADNNLGCPLS